MSEIQVLQDKCYRTYMMLQAYLNEKEDIYARFIFLTLLHYKSFRVAVIDMCFPLHGKNHAYHAAARVFFDTRFFPFSQHLIDHVIFYDYTMDNVEKLCQYFFNMLAEFWTTHNKDMFQFIMSIPSYEIKVPSDEKKQKKPVKKTLIFPKGFPHLRPSLRLIEILRGNQKNKTSLQLTHRITSQLSLKKEQPVCEKAVITLPAVSIETKKPVLLIPAQMATKKRKQSEATLYLK